MRESILKILALIALMGAVAWFATTPDWEPAVAVVVSLSGLLALELRSGPPTTDVDKFFAVGMKTIHDPLTDKNLRDRLAKSKDIRVLKTWFPESPEIEAGLELAIKQRARVRLLLCKPDSTVLKQRSLGAHEEEWWGSYKVYHAVKGVHELARVTQNTDIQIACYDSWPGCPVIWLDEEVLMGFYFRGKASPSWPWISVIKGSKLAQILDDQFFDLWKQPDTEHLDTQEEMARWLQQNESWRMSKRRSGRGGGQA